MNTIPYKPKRPCAYPGCGRLSTVEQYCAEHKKVMNHHYNHFQREPETNKRYGRAWKRIRDRFIKAHPLCEECKKAGRLTPAEEVHHVLPLSLGGTNVDWKQKSEQEKQRQITMEQNLQESDNRGGNEA